ncbi:hypothetical protein PR202_ga23996 [Eleusine coracana subsp. coracana]|uniref:aldehyde oxygenase (deformylating) n=1 Tax=Eleusine coracana subsp. coracana TaxID=191504 RepID=A0AAV5D7P8_ELECO|nr:hypothetical protein QOZ80_1AG0004050 [Eleusine coracana subsp. coracana]GJN06285.1 hypothetical protein PR202_ga23996 [Eleusine coracana subsp. coracana]
MIPYATATAGAEALGRPLSWAEATWLRYTSATPDYCLYYLNSVIIMIAYTLAPLPLALLELYGPAKLTSPYKLQPKVRVSRAAFLRCYMDSACRLLVLTCGPLLVVSYPAVKMVGIRMGLPLPAAGEVAAQLVVYFLVEDYLGYWLHRLLHAEWAYDKIHRVHHEFAAPVSFASGYSHWAELLTLGSPAFIGPAIVPCHVTTFWLWFVVRGVQAIDTHSGFKFPFSPTKFIPFYGGAEFHDYHHYVGKQCQSHFAPVFTFCDYIYGTDKGYRYQKASLAKDN